MEATTTTVNYSGCIKREELQQSFANGLTEPVTTLRQCGANSGGVVVLQHVTFQKFKSYLQHLFLLIISSVVAVLASSLRGDVLLFATLTYKTYLTTTDGASTTLGTPLNVSTTNPNYLTKSPSFPPRCTILPGYLQPPESYNLPDLLFYVVVSIFSSLLTYHVVCGFFQVYFYVLQRSCPEKWKCQPHRFLTHSNEIHEIVVGTSNMALAGGMSGFLTCWIANGHHTTVYFSPGEYGYPYLALSAILLFLWLEASAYYIHMMMHKPVLYKTLHKQHHRYHSPTAYSVVAMSPIELFSLDAAIILPIFVVPIYSVVYMAEVIYVYYFGLMDHSGVKMDSWFPWQPSTTFHDDHHRYFHCNYGFNTYLFDWLHGTLRRNDRIYGEHIFNPNKKKD